MTDRELLELAAKAMQATGAPHFANYQVMDDCVCLELGASRGDITAYWSPLTDDGDALRLAVKLNLTLRMYMGATCAKSTTPAEASVYLTEKNHDDPYAATRRAIVRAAAEIGKGMK